MIKDNSSVSSPPIAGAAYIRYSSGKKVHTGQMSTGVKTLPQMFHNSPTTTEEYA